MYIRPTKPAAITETILPDCKDELKKNPNFKGDCLKDLYPTSDEYEEFADSNPEEIATSNDTENRTLFGSKQPPPCPGGYMRNKSNKCKKIFKG